MNREKVKAGDWIYVGESRIPAYVIKVLTDTKVSAGYYQNNIKAIKENFLWDGEKWIFESSSLSGIYLGKDLETIIKRGPIGNNHE